VGGAAEMSVRVRCPGNERKGFARPELLRSREPVILDAVPHRTLRKKRPEAAHNDNTRADKFQILPLTNASERAVNDDRTRTKSAQRPCAETLESGSPHRCRFCGVVACARCRQDGRPGPRRLRRWLRMEAGGGHSPEPRLRGPHCPGA